MVTKHLPVADPYIDPNTGVLRNTFGITDDVSLHAAEVATARMNATNAMAIADRTRYLNEKALQHIHRSLFGEIYDWAGEFRTVYLHKADGGLPFEAPDRLAGAMKQRILPPANRLARRAGTDDAVFISALAKCWGELNHLHPFREGNGRATQIFIAAFAHRFERDIDWSKISHAAEQDAAIAAMSNNYVPYETLLATALRPFDPSRPAGQFWVEREAERE